MNFAGPKCFLMTSRHLYALWRGHAQKMCATSWNKLLQPCPNYRGLERTHHSTGPKLLRCLFPLRPASQSSANHRGHARTHHSPGPRLLRCSLHSRPTSRSTGLPGRPSLLLTRCCSRGGMSDVGENRHSGGIDAKEEDDNDEILHSDLYTDDYFKPVHGHNVLVIHPEPRGRGDRDPSTPRDVRAELQLAESCALIDALPGWTVVDKRVFLVRQLHPGRVFTKGVYERVLETVRACRSKSAVFLDVPMLTGAQLATLQQDWRVPVYDRYTIILQIFRLRARTQEAKLQLALAEIPYYRSRLEGMHSGDLRHQRGGLSHAGGTGETWLETRHNGLSEREVRIRAKLAEIRRRRDFQRQERAKRQLPLVAVVGYTNAGKTSLIKALTADAALVPWDQLFATLDVTCHAGLLGNRLRVLYLDTVGFISNIPTTLVSAFRATLDDITAADAIIHVRDVSHPDTVAQRATVLRTLDSLSVGQISVIEVLNKADLVQREAATTAESSQVFEAPADIPPVYTSTVTGQGLSELGHILERTLIQNTDRLSKTLKIPLAGPHLSWLYKEVTVTRTRSCDTDAESILVDVIMTESAYARFSSIFGKKKKLPKTTNR